MDACLLPLQYFGINRRVCGGPVTLWEAPSNNITLLCDDKMKPVKLKDNGFDFKDKTLMDFTSSMLLDLQARDEVLDSFYKRTHDISDLQDTQDDSLITSCTTI